MNEMILFGVLPYVATIIALCGGVYRYFRDRFTYSSLSTEFLENRMLFWASVAWHYGIVAILLAHLLSALFPGTINSFLGGSNRLYVAELIGFTLGLLALFGILLLIVRRCTKSRLFIVSSIMDWILLAALLAQVMAGLLIAISYRWGTAWYHFTAAPWLWSLAYLDPRIDYMHSLPGIVKFHAVNAFILIALFPFTRLVHIFTFPASYLWRSFQVVIWNKRLSHKKRFVNN